MDGSLRWLAGSVALDLDWGNFGSARSGRPLRELSSREAQHAPIAAADPVSIIVFTMEQKGLVRRDLERAIWSRVLVAEWR